jgi:hypothetical protein
MASLAVRHAPNRYIDTPAALSAPISVRAKVAADGCPSPALDDELGRLDAGAAGGVHSRVGMRLPFQRFSIHEQKMGSTPEACIDVRVNAW